MASFKALCLAGVARLVAAAPAPPPARPRPNESPCPNEVQHHRYASNDIRLGLRYIIPDFAPIGPAPVLVSKY